MRRKGFSLIELLVVIAIIAILAAILFPIMIQAKHAGKLANCKSTMKQMSSAMLAYSDDWSGRLPCWALNEVKHGRHQTWDRVIQPYIKNNKILKCAADPKSKDLIFNGADVIVRSYTYPGQLGGHWSPHIYKGKLLSDIPSTGKTVMLAERRQSTQEGMNPWWGSGAIIDALGRDSRGFENVDFDRHVGKANFTFVDGHVATYTADPANNRYPKFPGYQVNHVGVAMCGYNDPLPR